MAIPHEAVVAGYREILRRDPESKAVISFHANTFSNLSDFRQALLNSPEYQQGNPQLPPYFILYPGYKEEELELIRKYHVKSSKAEPGFIVDFVGTRFSAEIVWAAARDGCVGRVLGPPIPADFHAEAIEWIGVLKAVEAAKNQFSVLELGAGFGTWAICSAVAARVRGIKSINIHMVEGDKRHCQSARSHFKNNGFDPSEKSIIHAAVGVENGVAQWPRSDEPAGCDGWNNRPSKPGETDYMGRRLSDFVDVPVMAMSNLLDLQPEWNLVHMDIQGHEASVIGSCIEKFSERVKWIVVGTHSRKIEGDIFEMMLSSGWELENEKPSRFTWNPQVTLEGMTTMDGTQVWRNPRF